MAELGEYQKRRNKSAVSWYLDVLVKKAKLESGGSISLLSNTTCLEECLTRFDNKLILWYNDSTGNTRVVDVDID